MSTSVIILIIPGGHRGLDANLSVLSSTEVLTGNTWHSSTPLPTPLAGHCMVKINSSHVFIAGGIGDNGYSAAAHLYSSTSGTFSPLPDMAIARSYHACGILGTDVWVGGGRTTLDNRLKSVETFSLTLLPPVEG